MISTNGIVKELLSSNVNMSYHHVNRHLNELHEWGILRSKTKIADPVVPGGTRYISDVVSNYKPQVLGLLRQHVIFDRLPDEKSVNLFGVACDLHPYTHYRSIGIGKELYGYAQFDIPIKSEKLMVQYYRELSSLLGCKSFEVLNTRRTSTSELDLTKWSPKDNNWNFSIYGVEIENSLEYFWNKFLSDTDEYISTFSESVIENLTSLDLSLIREMNINAKVKTVELAKIYKVDASTISRRIKKLQKQVLDKSTLFYNRNKLDISTSQILRGDAGSASIIDTMHKLISRGGFPYRSSLISNRGKFLWIMNTPPAMAAEIGYFVWAHVKNFENIVLPLLNGKSWRYPFYNKNYDVNNRSWRTSKEYLYTIPLAELKNM